MDSDPETTAWKCATTCRPVRYSGLERALRSPTMKGMDNLDITINWEYFLGLVGTLIAIAYYANGRFTRIETTIEWLTEAVRGLKIISENSSAKLFNAESPVALTAEGYRVLNLSGLRSYVDRHQEKLVEMSRRAFRFDQYEFQNRTFQIFADLSFEEPLARRLNEFAFANGISTDLLRRVGAIYFREIASWTR